MGKFLIVYVCLGSADRKQRTLLWKIVFFRFVVLTDQRVDSSDDMKSKKIRTRFIFSFSFIPFYSIYFCILFIDS